MLPYIIDTEGYDTTNIYWNMRAVLQTLMRKIYNGEEEREYKIGTKKFNIEELGIEMGLFDYKYRYCFDDSNKEKILKTPPTEMCQRYSGWTYLGRHMVVNKLSLDLWRVKYTYKELHQCLVRTVKIMCHCKARFTNDVYSFQENPKYRQIHLYTSSILDWEFNPHNGIMEYKVNKAWFERNMSKLKCMDKLVKEVKIYFKSKYIHEFKVKYDNGTYLNKWTTDNKECCICYEETKCVGLKCCGNHNHVCVNCFDAVRRSQYLGTILEDDINGKRVCGIKFKCPMCRGESYINHKEFEKVADLDKYESYSWNGIVRILNNRD